MKYHELVILFILCPFGAAASDAAQPYRADAAKRSAAGWLAV
jgi:hypothetical protein